MQADPTPCPALCPRCGARFACGAQGPAPCTCGGITLDDAIRAALAARYRGCLCDSCLRAIAGGASIGPPA